MTTLSRSSRGSRLHYSLIGLWALAMIALPIFKWTFGTDIIPQAVTAALLVQFIAVAGIVNDRIGTRHTLFILGLVAASTWFIEFLGSSTGFPFGEYDYTNILQPQIGHVPLLIPLAWFMMLPSAWAIAELTAGRHRRLAYVAASSAAITAWDLFLDPQMVNWGFWEWELDGAYFGIPLSNYAGWLLTGAVVTLMVRPWRFALPLEPLLVVYAVVWFLQTVGLAVFWGQPGPALVGSLVMGGMLYRAVSRYRAAQ